MEKLAIVGASYLQNPLIEKAKAMGIETHVFAWRSNAIGEKTADYFYPISIIEKEAILKKCEEIGIDGICTIASDLAIITVNYIANRMGLIGNSMECTELATNKHSMRKCFEKNGDPSPKSVMVKNISDLENYNLTFPVIVKPIDRSGSRGIAKLNSAQGLEVAIEEAKRQGFEKYALIEEFVEGEEYSVECISWQGKHHFLAMTLKYTTGSPHFIETAHLEPAPVESSLIEKVQNIVFHALDSLGIKYGASHSELKISKEGDIKLIEIGSRMGGDFIGSNLVELSTGIDFVRAVIQVALGKSPDLTSQHTPQGAAVRFILSEKDKQVLDELKNTHPEYLVNEDADDCCEGVVKDSSTRFGFYLMSSERVSDLLQYLPEKVDNI